MIPSMMMYYKLLHAFKLLSKRVQSQIIFPYNDRNESYTRNACARSAPTGSARMHPVEFLRSYDDKEKVQWTSVLDGMQTFKVNNSTV